MKKFTHLLFALAFLFSCTTENNILDFSEFEIKDAMGMTRITLNSAGDVYIMDELMGKIKKDGTVEDLKGKVLAKLTESGIIQDKNGKDLIKIDDYGKMDNDSGAYIEGSESGELMKGKEKAGMSLHPANKNSQKAASIILYLYLSFQQ